MFTPDTVAVGIARLGQASQQIVVAPLKDLLVLDLGGPLHSLVIKGHTHFLEDDMLTFYQKQTASTSAVPPA